MITLTRITCVVAIMCWSVIASAQENAPTTNVTTSATDHKVRIHKTRRADVDHTDTQRFGGKAKKRKNIASGSSGGRDAKVYKRHRHFADRDIKLRSKSKVVRRESLGVE